MPDTIDAYIAALSAPARDAAQQLLGAIARAPRRRRNDQLRDPRVRRRRQALVFFAAWKRHLSLYPIPDGDAAFQAEIAAYRGGKGTLHFGYGDPLPQAHIARTVSFLRSEGTGAPAP